MTTKKTNGTRVTKKTPLEDWRERYSMLSDPLPPESLQHTSKGQTGRPYDTTGHGYQYAVNRLNELFPGEWEIHEDYEDAPDGNVYRTKCTVLITIGMRNEDLELVPLAVHTACAYGRNRDWGDARKGAKSVAIKRAASLHGVGWRTYAGELDPDIAPLEETLRKSVEAAKNGKLPAQQRKRSESVESFV